MLTEAQRWYLEKIPRKQRVVIHPYDPKIEVIVTELTQEIHAAVPELPIQHMGAAALRLSGQNDIDLYIFCPQTNFGEFLPQLMEELGDPSLQKPEHVEWVQTRSGFEITIYLTDPSAAAMKEQIQLFDLLKESTALRQKYESLKQSMDGQPLRLYRQKKYEFYNRVLHAHN